MSSYDVGSKICDGPTDTAMGLTSSRKMMTPITAIVEAMFRIASVLMALYQGLTIVHFSAQHKHFLRDTLGASSSVQQHR